MSAVLACGPEALLSHRSAAALWRFGEETPGVIDISIARHSSRDVRASASTTEPGSGIGT